MEAASSGGPRAFETSSGTPPLAPPQGGGGLSTFNGALLPSLWAGICWIACRRASSFTSCTVVVLFFLESVLFSELLAIYLVYYLLFDPILGQIFADY